MRAFAILSTAAVAALGAGARADEICLYGGPDAAIDLACGPAHVAPAPARSAPGPAASLAESQVERGRATRANDVAQSRILAGAPAAPAIPALPSNYSPTGIVPYDSTSTASASYESGPYGAPYAAAPGADPYAPAYRDSAPNWPAPPTPYDPAPYGPAPYAAAPAAPVPYAATSGADPYARGFPDSAPVWPAPPPPYDSAPHGAPYAAAPTAPVPYAAAPGADAYAPPPPEPHVAVQGSGVAPGAYAYAYESADGGAFAWRYDTPGGPAWAYAYETPEGWAYAYAYDTGAAATPPPMIEARGAQTPPASRPYGDPYADPYGGGPYRGPYVERGAAQAGFHNDWRYTEETRLYGASYPRQLYLVETWVRDTGWQTVAVHGAGRAAIACGACGASYFPGGPTYPVPAPHPGIIVSGGAPSSFGASGFGASGPVLVGAAGSTASASRSFSQSSRVSVTDQAMASAAGNGNVVSGRPFNPPSGAPTLPWGPPPNMAPTASASAYAAARAGR